MKICWDNLEDVIVNNNGALSKNGAVLIECDSCELCGESYITRKYKHSCFCSRSCAQKSRPPMSEANRKKLSLSRIGENNPFFGKTHTIKTRRLMSEAFPRCSGCLNNNYKGGIKNLGFTAYDTHKDTLGFYEDIRKQKNTEILEVRCAYCNRWFAPMYYNVNNRLIAINNLNKGEARLYCSENCKQACPTYRKKTYPKGFKHTTSREVSTYLRQMVFERDNWTCQICGKTIKEAQLHVHHTDPVRQHPMFQNDMDSCITLCKDCHKMVHSVKGCRYVDLQCKKVEQHEEEINGLRGMRKKKSSERTK